MIPLAVDVELASWWLGMLYEGAQPESWLTLFSVDSARGHRSVAWAELDDLGALRPSIADLGGRGDLWFGAAPRRVQLPNNQRGGVADCVSIPGLWLDVDVAGEGHKLPGLPADYDQAIHLVRRCEYRPTAVVRSGYGLQCWWVFAEHLPAVEASALLGRWQTTWSRLAKEHGVHLDNVANLDRVMRLPGTLNWKGAQPVPVTCKAKFQHRYDASHFDDWCDPAPATEERHRAFTAHLAGSRFNELFTAKDVFGWVGWTLVRTDHNGDQHWHHPGSSNDVGATTYAEDGHTTVWSETVAEATGCPLRRPLDCFGLWTFLVHHGDFVAAHGELVAKGITDVGLKASVDQLVGPDPMAVAALGHRNMQVTQLGGVMKSAVSWLWKGWLPRGKLVVCDGDPDVGKSTMLLDLAARISTGRNMPDDSPGNPAAEVILLAAEDDIDDTIVWRVEAAGGDLNRVHVVESVVGDHGAAPFTIPGDLSLLEALIVRLGAALVVVDVLNEYLDSRVDTHKDHDIRRTLLLMREVAKRTKVTFLLVRHLRKEGASKAIYRGGGSIGIVGAARGGWTVATHPDQEELRVLATTKMNLAARPVPWSFQLVPHPSMPCALVKWQGPVDIGVDALLDPGSTKTREERAERGTQLEQARQAIVSLLTQEPGMLSHELRQSIQDLGLGAKAYNLAHAELTNSWPEKLPDGTKAWRSYLKGHDHG
jgi:hypothetical protein